MLIDSNLENFLVRLQDYGFQVIEKMQHFEIDVIPPESYGQAPLITMSQSGLAELLFWYNYPKAPLLKAEVQIDHPHVSLWLMKAMLRTMNEHALKHGLQVRDTARLLNNHIYGGKQSEIQTGYRGYTAAELIQLTAMRHIPQIAMNTFLAGHLPVEHIRDYDVDISPEIYLSLFPLAASV